MKYFVFDYGNVLKSKIYYEQMKDEPTCISAKYENDEKIQNLNKKYRNLYFSGEIDEKDFIKNVRPYFNCPNISEKEYIDNFKEVGMKYSKVNPDIDYIVNLVKSKNYKIYILSNIGKLQEDELLNDVGASRFDGIFLSFKLHQIKPDKGIYQTVINKIGANPKDVYFFDDKEENVKSANEMGINAYVADFNSVKRKVNEIIEKIQVS